MTLEWPTNLWYLSPPVFFQYLSSFISNYSSLHCFYKWQNYSPWRLCLELIWIWNILSLVTSISECLTPSLSAGFLNTTLSVMISLNTLFTTFHPILKNNTLLFSPSLTFPLQRISFVSLIIYVPSLPTKYIGFMYVKVFFVHCYIYNTNNSAWPRVETQ